MIYFQEVKQVREDLPLSNQKIYIEVALRCIALLGCLGCVAIVAYANTDYRYLCLAGPLAVFYLICFDCKIQDFMKKLSDKLFGPKVNHFNQFAKIQPLNAHLCKYLKRKELVNLSHVSHFLETMTTESPIWLHRCRRDNLCSKNSMSSHILWSDVYTLSKKLKLQNKQSCEVFFISEQLTFISFFNSNYVTEIWYDYEEKITAYSDIHFKKTHFEKNAQTVYIHEFHPLSNSLTIFSYDLNTYEFKAKMLFYQLGKNCKPLVAFSESTAFQSMEGGIIWEWDLTDALYCEPTSEFYHKLCIYEPFSSWSISQEALWQTSESFRIQNEKLRSRHFNLPNCKKLIGHSASITSLKVKGDYLFSAAADQTLKKWDLRDDDHPCVLTIFTQFPSVDVMQITDDYIYALSDKTIKQWDKHTGGLKFQLNLTNPCDNFLAALRYIYCSSHKEKSKAIDIYNCQNLKRKATLNFAEKQKNSKDYYAMQIYNERLFFIADRQFASIRVHDKAID